MSKYILSERYALRGYKGLPYGILDLGKGTTFFMSEASYALAASCNGQVELDEEILPPVAQRILSGWLEKGIIRKCTSDSERLEPIQKYIYYKARFKEAVHWSITGKCNYRCKHCFMSATHAVQGEPSFDDCMKMLDAFDRCGIYNLHITGGEPLVRRDFWQIMDMILLRGMGVQAIYTNGRLVTDEFFENLKKRYMHPMIQFSFDGIGFHDWMRGVEGAEKEVIEAMKRCKKHGFSFNAVMSLCKDNAPSIRETVRLMKELGCSHFKVGTAYAQGEWAKHPEHFLSQEQTYEIFLDYIPKYFEDGCPVPLGLEGFFNYEPDEKTGELKAHSANEKNIPDDQFRRVKMCGHVRKSMYVSPTGNVLPCMSMIGLPIEERFPNMLITPLEEILDKGLYMDIINYSIKDFMDHNPDCAECGYKNLCVGGCRAFAVRENPNDYLSKDPWSCRFFKGGWMDRKNELFRRLGLITGENDKKQADPAPDKGA